MRQPKANDRDTCAVCHHGITYVEFAVWNGAETDVLDAWWAHDEPIAVRRTLGAADKSVHEAKPMSDLDDKRWELFVQSERAKGLNFVAWLCFDMAVRFGVPTRSPKLNRPASYRPKRVA